MSGESKVSVHAEQYICFLHVPGAYEVCMGKER